MNAGSQRFPQRGGSRVTGTARAQVSTVGLARSLTASAERGQVRAFVDVSGIGR